MEFKGFRFIFLAIACMFCSIDESNAQAATEVRDVEVSMRMIGHQILIGEGDSTSRILPIQKEGNRFRIRFENEFQFSPNELVATVDSVLIHSQLGDGYLVEVEDCDTEEIVYGYVVRALDDSSVIPCGKRPQPCGCYNVLVTILNDKYDNQSNYRNPPVGSEELSSGLNQGVLLILIVMLLLIGWAVNFKKKKLNPSVNLDIIEIGKYQFDKKNMNLSYEQHNMELTSKEADLLYLLHTSVNNTLERDQILKVVWGNEGDYVGRTLDVFISKLRKKLEADPTVKIVNVRGVGYKLITNNV